MPLSKSPSKKAFESNLKTELKAGKPKAQSLAISYSIQRKNKGKKKKMADGGSTTPSPSPSPDTNPDSPVNQFIKSFQNAKAKGGMIKKMADGGEVSAATEKRPMPDDEHNDEMEVGRNRGNKAPKDDSWTDQPTVTQAQKPSITKLSSPRIVGSDAFSVRDHSMRDDEKDLMDSDEPQSDKAQPKARDNEEGADRQGPAVSDNERQHNNKRPAYAKGGPVMQPKDTGVELDLREDEAHDVDSMAPASPDEQPPKMYDEMDAKKSGNMPPDDGGMISADSLTSEEMDMIHKHRMAKGGMASMANNPKLQQSKMAEGGVAREMPIHLDEDEEHPESVADGVMRKRKNNANKEHPAIGETDSLFDFPKKMADGGEAIRSKDSIYSDDSSQADVSRNADEDANMEDQSSFNSLRKENYSDSEGLAQMDSPRGSNLKGDDLESDIHDMVDKIRSKIRSRI